jgi:hypothetical protein
LVRHPHEVVQQSKGFSATFVELLTYEKRFVTKSLAFAEHFQLLGRRIIRRHS